VQPTAESNRNFRRNYLKQRIFDRGLKRPPPRTRDDINQQRRRRRTGA
jgi:hypothetical protein